MSEAFLESVRSAADSLGFDILNSVPYSYFSLRSGTSGTYDASVTGFYSFRKVIDPSIGANDPLDALFICQMTGSNPYVYVQLRNYSNSSSSYYYPKTISGSIINPSAQSYQQCSLVICLFHFPTQYSSSNITAEAIKGTFTVDNSAPASEANVISVVNSSNSGFAYTCLVAPPPN